MRTEQTEGIAAGPFEEINSEKRKQCRSRSRAEQKQKQKAESRADDSKCGMVQTATFIFHWKLFPSNAVARIKYQSKNNNINLSSINILYE